ncbi:MAG: DNA-binding MarR family transcriptional regulator [Saprospiraceae bacterium]
MQKTGFKDVDNCNPSLCINGKISRAQRIVAGVFRKYLKEFGITSSQLSVLFVLSKRGKTSQNELVNILYLEKSSVSRNKRRLVSQGWVENEDLNLMITKKGLVFLNKIIPSWDKAMEEIKLRLGNDGQVGLDSVLSQLT